MAMTVRQAAESIGCHIATVYKIIEDLGLPTSRGGTRGGKMLSAATVTKVRQQYHHNKANPKRGGNRAQKIKALEKARAVQAKQRAECKAAKDAGALEATPSTTSEPLTLSGTIEALQAIEVEARRLQAVLAIYPELSVHVTHTEVTLGA